MKRAIGTIAYPIGVPMAWDEFGWSFSQLAQFTQEHACKPGQFVNVDRFFVNDVVRARNGLVERMRGEWLLQLDADHAFEPDLCLRLLDRMERTGYDIVSGLYFDRHPPHGPLLWQRTTSGDYVRVGEWPKVPFEIPGAVGAGCLLVRRQVFERILSELKEAPFDRRRGLDEDVSFFDRCYQLGIKGLCDPRIEHPHLSVRPIGSMDYRASEVMLYEPA